MTPTAWHCPGCNKWHAPHVDTCVGEVSALMPVFKVGAVCVCPPELQMACASAACPRRTHAYPTTGNGDLK